MRNHWEKQEGILIHAVQFLENKRILKVFTPQKGLLSLMARYRAAKPSSLTSPICRGEWIFESSQHEIHNLKDAALLDPLLFLRSSYAVIQSAGVISSALLRSQLPNKSSQTLYDILHSYLRYLPQNPEAGAQSFRLKLLQTDGLLDLREICSQCSEPSQGIAQGECFCRSHMPASGLLFQKHDWKLLLILGQARRFSELDSCRLPDSLTAELDRLFLTSTS